MVLSLDAVLPATTDEIMSLTIPMVKGDTRPTLEFTVKDASGTVINITGATGIFRIRRKHLSAALLSRAIAVTDGPNGKCQFVWQTTDWDTGKLDAAGLYEGELEITFGAGAIGTAYDLYDIIVRDQVG